MLIHANIFTNAKTTTEMIWLIQYNSKHRIFPKSTYKYSRTLRPQANFPSCNFSVMKTVLSSVKPLDKQDNKPQYNTLNLSLEVGN